MGRRDVHADDMYDHDPTLAAFAHDLQDAATATPAPAVGASLAAVLDGRAPATVYPEVLRPPRVRPARRSLRLRWAVAGAAFGIGAGSLGIAGALPGPVQRQVSRMAEVVGVDLPDGGRDSGPVPTTPVRPSVPPSTVVVPPRPSVVPADDRPVPSTVPDDPSNRGNSEDRGRGDDDERESDRSQGPTIDDEDVRDDLDDDRSGPDDGDDAEPEVDDDEDGNRPGEGDADPDSDDGDEPDEADDEDALEKVGARRNPSMITAVHPED